MADVSYEAFRDAALRFEVDPLHPMARLAVDCAYEAERGLGMTLDQARRWAKLQLSGRPLREHAYLLVQRRVHREHDGTCSRCEYPLAPLNPVYVPMVDERDLGLKFCSYRCADLRLQGPLRVEYAAEAA